MINAEQTIAQGLDFQAEHTLHAIRRIPRLQNVTSVEIKFGYDEYTKEGDEDSLWPTLVVPFIEAFSMLPKLRSFRLTDLMVEGSGPHLFYKYGNLMDRITELDISFVSG